MASDGSLKFDTKINIEGFEEGISTLTKAMDRLKDSVDRLSQGIIDRFNGVQTSAEHVAQGAETAAQGVDEITEAAKAAEMEAERLQKQMDKIQINTMEDINTEPVPERRVQVENPAAYGYDPSVMKFIEDYEKKLASSSGDKSSGLLRIKEEAEISNQEIIELTERLSQLKARQDMLRKAGVGLGYAEYERNAAQIAQMTARLKEYEASLLKTKAETRQYTGVVASVKAAFSNLPAFFSQLRSDMATAFKTAPVKLYHAAVNGLRTAFTGMAASAKKAALALAALGLKGLRTMAFGAANGLLRMGKAFLGLNKSAQKGQKGFSMLRMLGQGLAFSMIFRGLSAITRAFREGIQGMAQYSSSFNGTMSSFVTSLSQLKYSFAAAFSPLTSIVVPALDALIQKIIQAINVVGQLLAALTGKGTFTKAVRVNKDYADSLKKTGGAAKQAGKDAEKALAPFDDLVQIQQQGTDASGGAGGGVDPSQMFTEEAVSGGISDFANKLRELFEAGDWEGIGQLIGQKINDAVQSFTDYISWDNVGSRITSFVTAFTTMFNSLVGTIDWYSIGILMGTGINTLANTLFLLLTQIDWFLLGNALSQGLMGLVNTVDWNLFGATIGAYFQARISGLLGFVVGVDWGAIGKAISTGLMGLTGQINWEQLGYLFAAGLNAVFRTMGTFASTFEWTEFGSQLASSLSTFFQTFDWAGAGTAISDIVIGLLNALIAFIAETDWMSFGEGVAVALENISWATIAARIWTVFCNALAAVFATLASFFATLIIDGVTGAQSYFQKKIEECGDSLGKGILKGIKDALNGIGAWIVNNIFTPFMDAFKDAFGIHSPSTVMAEMGQYLWDGFCNGIKEFFSDPGAFIKANITDPFVNKMKSLLGIHSPSTVLAGIGSYTVQGFNQGVTSEQTASQNVVQSWASGVANWFAEKFGIGSGDATESKKWASSIMSGFNNTVRKNYTQSQSLMEIWADSIRTWFTGTDESKGVNGPSWEKFADLIIQAFKTKIEGSNTETKGPVEAWARSIREWFWGDSDPQGTGGLYAAFYNMAKRINEGFANGISDFAYMAKDAIRRWAKEAMEEAEEEFDINSPSREFYAIAEYVVRGFNNGITDMAASSRSAVQKWLDGVMGIFDGVNIQLPVGLSLPDAASYLPRMASGTIVPPRAGETAFAMKNPSYGQEETLGYLTSKIDELISRIQTDGEKPIQIVLNLTGNMAALARMLKPELDKEAARKGVSLVIVGGT